MAWPKKTKVPIEGKKILELRKQDRHKFTKMNNK